MMKRTLLIGLFAMLSMMVWAQNNVITYTADSKLEMTNESFSPGLHPKAFKESILSHAFSNSMGVITFSADVTSIGFCAFYKCSGLVSITIPSSVTNIGYDAFYMCEGLTSVTIPNSVTSIDESAFSWCSSLRSVIIPNSVTSIGEHAFWGCESLTSVTIPNSVTSIENNTFSCCRSLTFVNIPNSVTSIGISAFHGCNRLTSVIIPNSVKSIDGYAFAECFNLKRITIPNSVTSIGNRAFSDCHRLISITIPDSVTSIGSWTFCECNSLDTITFPNSITSIGKNAFKDCKQLTTIRVPNQSIKRFIAMKGLAGKKNKIVGYDDTQLADPAIPQSDPNAPPAILSYVDNSLQFIEKSANNIIDGNEQCAILLQVSNSGKGAGVGCVAKISATGTTQGLSFKDVVVPSIAVGKTQTIEIPITSDTQTKDGSVTFSIEVIEPHGFGIDPIKLTIPTKAFNAPMLKIVDYVINGGNANAIKKKAPFELRILLQNIKNGKAEDVTMQVSVPEEVTILDGKKEMSFASIQGGEQKSADYQFIVSSYYAKASLPVSIVLKEKHGRFAENRDISIPIENADNGVERTLTGQSNGKDQTDITIGTLARDGSTTFGSTSTTSANSNIIESIVIVKPFDQIPMSSVLALYNNEFSSFEMRERDDSFPYTLFRVRLQGNGNKIRLAKNSLQLNLGQMNQVEKTVTSYENTILFLIPRRVRTVYLTCGDGCEQVLIFSGQLEGNKVYEGTVEVK